MSASNGGGLLPLPMVGIPTALQGHVTRGARDGHGRRVGALAARIAAQLGIRGAARSHIDLAGSVHDVGKLWISSDILDKPGPLTPDEMDIVRQHPVLGALALTAIGITHARSVTAATIVYDVVLSHHERWDGAGYPHRRASTDIPFVARIVAVADVFDAMTHVRSYHPAMPQAEAERVITQESGKMFDPTVVHAFLALQRQPIRRRR